jgi:hypothetical protein
VESAFGCLESVARTTAVCLSFAACTGIATATDKTDKTQHGRNLESPSGGNGTSSWDLNSGSRWIYGIFAVR